MIHPRVIECRREPSGWLGAVMVVLVGLAFVALIAAGTAPR